MIRSTTSIDSPVAMTRCSSARAWLGSSLQRRGCLLLVLRVAKYASDPNEKGKRYERAGGAPEVELSGMGSSGGDAI